MQGQTLTVAVIVVVTFGAGFFTGRMSVPSPAAPPVAAPAPTLGMTGFPGAAAKAPSSAEEAEGAQVGGTLAEVIQVPNYSYLRVSTSHGDEWAAVSADTSLTVGQQVTVGHATPMESFASKTLNRTFEKIWFGALVK